MPLTRAQFHLIVGEVICNSELSDCVQDCQLSLIQIPLELYPLFLQPILRLLCPRQEQVVERVDEREPWTVAHPFLNISITPMECSVVCLTADAREFFEPVIGTLGARAKEVSISQDEYIVFQVDGEGLDAGQRVLELTSPLALAGICIFFITTYFSDYILVPCKSRDQVAAALEARGFVFDRHSNAFISQFHGVSHSPTPPDPPPSQVEGLEQRTFALLDRQKVSPQVDPAIRLVQCAGRRESPMTEERLNNEIKFQLGLVKCLVSRPLFLSLTLTSSEPASLLLETRLLPRFGASDVLLGSKQDILIPIMLDLRRLPPESTGIVCGVAGRLVRASKEESAREGETADGKGTAAHEESAAAAMAAASLAESAQHAALRQERACPSPRTDLYAMPPPSSASAAATSLTSDMSYLSTATAGTVMVVEPELGRAMDALRGEG